MENSKMFMVDVRDFAKGAALAIITAVVTFYYEAIQAGPLTSASYEEAFRVALVAFVAYIIKNYLTDSDGRLLGKV